jgi:hypothetical protein
MKSNLNFDDFFVFVGQKYSGAQDRRFSLLGLQFFTEFVTQAVVKAGLNPSQVTIRVGEQKYYYDGISIAWPSPATALLTRLSIKTDPTDGAILTGERRGHRWGVTKAEDFNIKLKMADPNIIDQLAEIIKLSIPKNSKFMEKEA